MSTNDDSNHPRAAAPPDQSAPPAVSAPAPAEGGAAPSDAPGQRPGRPIARVGVLLDGVRWVAPATDGGERLNGREKAILSADRVLTGGRQGRELDVLDAGGLYIEGTRIAAVGRAADLLAAHPHARHVNFPGATLMPGLIETHAHLATSGTDVEYPDYGPDEVARLTLNAAASARELLSIGVTSVQSLGARHYVDVALRDAIEAGTLRGRRVLASGPQITTTAGHSWQAGAEVDGLDGIRREVRAHHRRGVDVVKVMATGGFTTDGSAPWFAQFSQDELAVLFAEAHRLGKRTAAHAHGTEGIERAVAAGVDYIAHASFVSPSGRSVFDPRLADAIAEAGVYVDTTSTADLPEIVRRDDSYRPPVRELHEHGVRIVAGHDSGIPGVPHRAYVAGLEALEAFGVPRTDVLMAATSRAAAAIGLAGITGFLTPGYDADVIAVAGDPRDGLGALRDLRIVVSRGREFAPDALAPVRGLGEEVEGDRAVLGPAVTLAAWRERAARAAAHPRT